MQEAARCCMKRHVLAGRSEGYFCNTLLSADLSSEKAEKSHLVLAEGVKPSLGLAQALPGPKD